MEVVGLNVHTMDARPAAGSSKRRGSLRQWLEVVRRCKGKGDVVAWSSASASMAVVLWHARVAPRVRESVEGVERVRERRRGSMGASKSKQQRRQRRWDARQHGGALMSCMVATRPFQ